MSEQPSPPVNRHRRMAKFGPHTLRRTSSVPDMATTHDITLNTQPATTKNTDNEVFTTHKLKKIAKHNVTHTNAAVGTRNSFQDLESTTEDLEESLVDE